VFTVNLGERANIFKSTPVPTFAINVDDGIVTANVEGLYRFKFAVLGSDKETAIGAHSQALFGNSNIELVMMLDVTGSMADELPDLQEAAEGIINELLPEGGHDDPDRARIGIVPYSDGVFLSRDYYTQITGLHTRQEVGGGNVNFSTQSGCVVERRHDTETDAPADDRLGRPSKIVKKPDNNYFPDDPDVMNDLLGDIPNRFYPHSEADQCPDVAAVPLTHNKQALLDAIDDLDVGGCTAGHVGAAFTYYNLSPRWNDVWETDAAAYSDDGTMKVALLMTDGKNSVFYRGEDNDYFDNEGGSALKCNSSKQDQAQALADEVMEDICDNMRDDGIIVYSVAFNAPQDAEQLLRRCASSDDTYFEPQNGDQLVATFTQIGAQLTQLRLSQ